MSRSKNLRHNVINQFIEDMARGYIPSPLPSQSALAEMYNVSRTTVRHILSHLHQCGVITLSGKEYVIARKPDHNDGLKHIKHRTIQFILLLSIHIFYAHIKQRRFLSI